MGTRNKRDIRATMVRIKAKVENLMGQLETLLGTDPVPMLSLQRRLSKAEDVWSEYEGLYDQLCAIHGEDWTRKIATISRPSTIATPM